MLEEAARLIGPWASRPEWHQSHRWRHARVDRGAELAGPMLLRLPGGGHLGLAGEIFAPGGGVEAAWTSGRRLARRILSERSHEPNDAALAALVERDRDHECDGLGPQRVCVRSWGPRSCPTRFGDFRIVAFWNNRDAKEHVAMVHGRRRGNGRGPDAPALGVPDRRRDGLAALRLPRSARGRPRDARRDGSRHAALPAARGPRHRPDQQDPRVLAAGPRARHGRGEPRPRLPGRRARLRGRRPHDPEPRREIDSPDHQQPDQDHAAHALRRQGGRADPPRDPAQRAQPLLPRDQGRALRSLHRLPGKPHLAEQSDPVRVEGMPEE